MRSGFAPSIIDVGIGLKQLRMKFLRSGILVLGTLASVTDRAQAQTVFFEDFESGYANWTMTGQWKPQSEADFCGSQQAPFPSATHAVWFGSNHGSACDYAVPDPPWVTPKGDLTMVVPVALVGTGQSAWLRYRTRLQSEGCLPEPPVEIYDYSSRSVSIDQGQTWIPLHGDCRKSTNWRKGRADLTPYMGQSVLIRFSFDAGDSNYNDYNGWWIDDVELRIETGVPICDADATCPCNNYLFGFFDASTANIGGCHNSATPNKRGGELTGSGVASIGQDSVVLTADGMTLGTTALLFQGSALTPPQPLGDGTLCLGGQILRVAVRPAPAGTLSYPQPSDLKLSQIASANTTFGYQVWYRNATPSYCTPATYNLTNAYAVQWAP